MELFFFSSRRRHTICSRDWSSDVCSSDLPATHGVLRLVLELEGETVMRCIPHIGYLHSGFEKLGEYRHYNQIIPLTDRTDYLSPMANNVGLALAAEKLMGIEVTERCRVLRVI